jgi:hypothetical protein
MATIYFEEFTIGSTQRSPEYLVNAVARRRSPS